MISMQLSPGWNMLDPDPNKNARQQLQLLAGYSSQSLAETRQGGARALMSYATLIVAHLSFAVNCICRKGVCDGQQ